jgi:hypothetical protein
LFLILPKAALSLLKKASAIIRSYENVASLSAAKTRTVSLLTLGLFLAQTQYRRGAKQDDGLAACAKGITPMVWQVIEKPQGNWRVQPNLLSYERTKAKS